MSKTLKSDIGLYEEATVIDPYVGDIWNWAGEVVRRAQAEPSRRFLLLFNGIYVPVTALDTQETVADRYHQMRGN